MEHTINLDQSFYTPLTAKDRNAIIRYCISIGTRAKCSTRHLLRPFKQKYLTIALKEMKAGFLKRIGELKEQIDLYHNDQLELSEERLDFFGGKPSKKNFENYIRALIKQERDCMKNVLQNHIINVDFAYCSKNNLKFHNSLNPRITFGYSNCLHEECDFALTDAVKNALLSSSLKDLPEYKQDWTHDWGYLFFDSIIDLLYEDLCVLCGERCILDTTSHEKMMTVCLTDEEIENMIDFENRNRENGKTIKKLKSLIGRQD